MRKERLQILVDPEQRRGLDAEAERLGSSIGSVVRGAIDARLGGGDRSRRVGAVEEMARAARGVAPPLEELESILDEERSLGSSERQAR